MDFKKYTLHEHIEYAKDSYYMDHPIDIACTIPKENYIQTRTGNTTVDDIRVNGLITLRNSVQAISVGKYTISICGALWYQSKHDTEIIRLPNVHFTTSNNRITNKYYSLGSVKIHYNVTDSKTIAIHMSDKYHYKITQQPSKTKKDYSINGINMWEEATSTGKIVKSFISKGTFKVRMEKKVSQTEGIAYVKLGNTTVNFIFEGEPSFIRLLSNKFVFNLLIDTELGSIIKEARTIVTEAITELCKVHPTKQNAEKLIEYYTNGH
ncbi:hypothetical protein XaC1_92 [Xanthomonas phage XaC1]|nr:hypothetical protein XaC1_92 [Xanthomonas phage XaC1]